MATPPPLHKQVVLWYTYVYRFIFSRELGVSALSFFKSIRKALLQAHDEGNDEAIVVLTQLMEYLRGPHYSGGVHFSSYVDELVKGTKHSEIAVLYGLSLSAVSNSVVRNSKRLYLVFGDNFFANLSSIATLQKSKEQLDSVVSASKFKVEDVVDKALYLRAMREKPNKAIRLEDCVDEIRFLAKYNKVKMQEEYSNLDNEKFVALIHSLGNFESNVTNNVNKSIVRNMV